MKLPPSKVTADPTSARPTIDEPWPNVTDAYARMVPANELDRPIVALDPTCQYTYFAEAPFTKTIDVYAPVITVDVAWKTHSLIESFCPSNVSTVEAAISNVPGLEQ